jgi:hypothetical protein
MVGGSTRDVSMADRSMPAGWTAGVLAVARVAEMSSPAARFGERARHSREGRSMGA